MTKTCTNVLCLLPIHRVFHVQSFLIFAYERIENLFTSRCEAVAQILALVQESLESVNRFFSVKMSLYVKLVVGNLSNFFKRNIHHGKTKARDDLFFTDKIMVK